MRDDGLPKHSPLGGSSMARAIACPGSAPLAADCVDDESEYAAEGTAAHTLAEFCLLNSEEPWQKIGCYVDEHGLYDENQENAFAVDKEMADAVQVYLDELKLSHPKANPEGDDTFVELPMHCPTIHKYFWSKSDFVYLDQPKRTLHVWDYKHGAGIMVFPENNVQGKYYACGVLEQLDIWKEFDTVVIHIVQPRGYMDPHRYWETTTDNLLAWMINDLIPAMDRAETATGALEELSSGEHCRFCPVRNYACPRLVEDMKEFTKMLGDDSNPKVGEYSLSQLGRFLKLRDIAKGTVGRAADKVAFARLMAGKKVPGRKLVNARSNRVWKDPAKVHDELMIFLGITKADLATLRRVHGLKNTLADIFSPAQVEKKPGGAALVARLAHKPDKGLTVENADDPRTPVSKDTKSMFENTPVKSKRSK